MISHDVNTNRSCWTSLKKRDQSSMSLDIDRREQEERRMMASRLTPASPIKLLQSPQQSVRTAEKVNVVSSTPGSTTSPLRGKAQISRDKRATTSSARSDADGKQELSQTKNNCTKALELMNTYKLSETTGKPQGSGWRTAPFIFGGEIGERTGSFGIQMNFINFLIFEMNLPLVTAANTVTNFFAITCMTTLGGAILADAYLGRFRIIAVSCFLYLAGLLVFTMTASMASFRPPPCDMMERFLGTCQQPSSLQMGVLFISLTLQCLGSGGVRPCVAPFGADQFDKTHKKHKNQLRHYFNWYYMCIGLAFLASLTVTVYIQDSVGWGWGAGVCAILMAAGTTIFLLGSPFYQYLPPTGSPLKSVVQVIVAALRKHKHELPANPDHLYEARKYQDKEGLETNQELLSHTENFRFLDKAAIFEDVEEEPNSRKRLSPWRLASVHQVEELKILLRMLPVWFCAITVATVIVQSSTFSVRQASTMDRHLGRLVVPPASMGVFSIITLLIFIPVYDLLMIRILKKLTGHPKGLTYLQRIGVGLFLSVLAMVTAALVETKRRKVAHEADMVEQMPGSSLPISAFWLVPQYVLAGLCESFLMIGELEFFYDEAPVSVRSMSNAFLWTALGVGSFLSSALVSIIQDVTREKNSKNGHGPGPGGSYGHDGWLQDNINRGRLDHFYWVLAALCCLNCLAYSHVANWYVYKNSNLFDEEGSSDWETDKEKALGHPALRTPRIN